MDQDLRTAGSGLSDLMLLGSSNAEGIFAGKGLGCDGMFELTRRIRGEGAATVSFDLGNFFPAERMDPSRAARVANALAFDVCVIGPWECADGENSLETYLSALDAEVLGCNLASAPAPVAARIRPYAVIGRAGRRIGFVGVMDPAEPGYRNAGITVLPFDRTGARVTEAAEECRRAGAETVVLLARLDQDRNLSGHWTVPTEAEVWEARWDPDIKHQPDPPYPTEEEMSVIREHASAVTPALLRSVSGVDIVCSSRPVSCPFSLLADARGREVHAISATPWTCSVMTALLTSGGHLFTGEIDGKKGFRRRSAAMGAFVKSLFPAFLVTDENGVPEEIPEDPPAPELPEPSPHGVYRPSDGDLVLLFTSDAHNHFRGGLGYDGVLAYRDRIRRAGIADCLLFDCGDAYECEEDPLAGPHSVGVVSRAGYDYCTLGNNEFDYPRYKVAEFGRETDTQFLCCNLRYIGNDPELDLFTYMQSHTVVTLAGRRIGLVGVTSPKSGDKRHGRTEDPDTDGQIYSFGHESNETMAAYIQEAVDACYREGAETVLLLSHLGRIISKDILPLVRGVSVELDAHTHKALPYTLYEDADGAAVLYAQNRSHLETLGQVIITKNGFRMSSLIRTQNYTEKDPAMTAFLDGYLGAE